MDPKIPRQRWRHLGLLILLLLLFIVSPIVAPQRYGVLFLNVVAAAILLLGTRAVSERWHLFTTTLVLAIATIGLNGSILVWKAHRLILVSNFCFLVLLALFSISILANVLQPGPVTADKIYGAICVYLLIGYAWAFCYAILEQIEPGSFSGPAESGAVADYVARVIRMRYFSFVTLTTVGFGDITPRSSVARTFATLEAVMGQIYLAVLVARLVGLHIVDASRERSRDDS